jgi:hypothetical protein
MGKQRIVRWPLLLLAAALFVAGCSRQDTDRLAKIGSILAERTEKAVDVFKDDFAEDWKGLDNRFQQREALRRVATRLQAEKSLVEARIEVAGRGEVIELKGEVKDLVQKRRALELAETTLGVTKVEDHLRIGE